jgi:uncharacterized surface protein with fasciclin (FAS1) repeats
MLVPFFLAAFVPFADGLTILETVNNLPQLSTLAGLFNDPNYAEVVALLTNRGSDPLTLFAPNDAAFTGWDFADINLTKATLTYHLLNHSCTYEEFNTTNYPSSLLADPMYVNLAGFGQTLRVNKNASGLTLPFNWGEAVSSTGQYDIMCDDGVIHEIDAVVLIPDLTSNVALGLAIPTMRGLWNLVNYSSELDTYASQTFLAANELAFSTFASALIQNNPAIIRDLLDTHVVEAPQLVRRDLIAMALDGQELQTKGGRSLTLTWDSATDTIFIGGARVVQADILTQNGVFIILDDVIRPFVDYSHTVVENLALVGTDLFAMSLTTPPFASILARLQDLSAQGIPVTVFAPSDASWANVSTFPDLPSLLSYHFMENTTFDSSMAGLHFYPTLLNSTTWVHLGGAPQVVKVTISRNFEITAIGDEASRSTVIYADQATFDGMIHLVDIALGIPPNASQVVQTQGNNKFYQKLRELNLTEFIDAEQGITLLAPIDRSLDEEDSDVSNDFVMGRLFHGRVLSSDIRPGTSLTLTALNGKQWRFVANANGLVTVGDYQAWSLGSNGLSSNGVVHALGLENEDDSELSTGAIVGLVIGVLALAAIVFACVKMCLKKTAGGDGYTSMGAQPKYGAT